MQINKLALAGAATAVAVGAVVLWPFIEEPVGPPLLVLESGFTYVVPPANFYGPGTFNTVEIREDGSFALHPTCSLSEGELQEHLIRSRTPDREIEENAKAAFSATIARDLAQLAAGSVGSSGEMARTVDLAFRDSYHVTMSDQSLLALRKALLSGGCEEAILHNLRAGAMVCQIAAVFQADLIYNARESQDIGSKIAGGVDKLGATAEINGETSREDKVVADDMFFGVRLHEFGTGCLKLAEPVANMSSAGRHHPDR